MERHSLASDTSQQAESGINTNVSNGLTIWTNIIELSSMARRHSMRRHANTGSSLACKDDNNYVAQLKQQKSKGDITC